MPRPLRHLVLALVAGLVGLSPAAAQEVDWHRFYPLEVGSVWEYERESGQRLDSYRRISVLGDTTIGTVPYRQVRVLERDATLELVAEALCAVRVVEETGQVEWVSVEGTCNPIPGHAGAMFDLREGAVTPQASVWIGGMGYEVSTRSPFLSGYSLQFGEAVGLLRWEQISTTCFCSVVSETLVYAEVGEAVYGMPPEQHEADAFFLLSTGDVRVYERYHRYGYQPPVTSYDQLTVVGDTLAGGTPYSVVRVERFDRTTLGLVGTARCMMRYDPETGRAAVVEVLAEGGDCSAFGVGGQPWDLRLYAATQLQEVTIGDQPYALITITHASGGSTLNYEVLSASGVGVIAWEVHNRVGSQGGHSDDVVRLVYADTEGGEYGHDPLYESGAGAGVALPAPLSLEAAYPNPFRATATLVLTLPAAEAVTLEAFDVLGRRVLRRDLGVQPAGASRHTLSGAALAPGVYFVRATTASGQRATQRIVRVE